MPEWAFCVGAGALGATLINGALVAFFVRMQRRREEKIWEQGE